MKLEIDIECPAKERMTFLNKLQVLMNEEKCKWTVLLKGFDNLIMKSGEKQ